MGIGVGPSRHGRDNRVVVRQTWEPEVARSSELGVG